MPLAGTLDTGISFGLTGEQKALRQLARNFAARELRPRAAAYDASSTHPGDVVAKAHAAGIMNPHIPEVYGGAGLGCLDGTLITEELNWGCSGMAAAIGGNALGAQPVILFGTEEQKRRWLSALVEEPILCSFALSEPEAGSDVAAIQTSAVRRGGDYVLNGSKTFITNAGHAAWTVVFAKSDRDTGHRGLSAFVVPMDADGVVVEGHLDKMGQRAAETSAIAFHDVAVPVAHRIGGEGEGFAVAMGTLDVTRSAVAAAAVGVARAAYEHAVEYAKQRRTFGVPISEHQAVSFMVADMATKVEAARLLTWRAAWLVDQAGSREATLYLSMAKRFAADAAMEVTTDAVQIFGGYGYMKEYPVEKLMRDAKVFQIYEGTSEIQRLVIGREIFGRRRR